jgi:hypothetical protein
MKRKVFTILAVTIASLLSVQGAFPWGSLTHAYITSQIFSQDGALRMNAVYGSTAPDFVNYMFDSPYQGYLMEETHVNFLRVWKMARGGPSYAPERAAAYGYVAHNDEDYTAHSMSQTLDPGLGYVIQKAVVLNDLLAGYGVWVQLGISEPEYAGLREELSHELIEFAGDFLVALTQPGIGQLLSDSAAGRYGDFPALINKAYAGNLVAFSNKNGIRLNQPTAAGILSGGELAFQGIMIYYGQLFASTDPDVILNNMAVYLQMLAQALGIEIDDPSTIIPIIQAAIYVIQSDFGLEISRTAEFTAEMLAMQKVAF